MDSNRVVDRALPWLIDEKIFRGRIYDWQNAVLTQSTEEYEHAIAKLPHACRARGRRSGSYSARLQPQVAAPSASTHHKVPRKPLPSSVSALTPYERGNTAQAQSVPPGAQPNSRPSHVSAPRPKTLNPRARAAQHPQYTTFNVIQSSHDTYNNVNTTSSPLSQVISHHPPSLTPGWRPQRQLVNAPARPTHSTPHLNHAAPSPPISSKSSAEEACPLSIAVDPAQLAKRRATFEHKERSITRNIKENLGRIVGDRGESDGFWLCGKRFRNRRKEDRKRDFGRLGTE